jgi:hypothetical protein
VIAMSIVKVPERSIQVFSNAIENEKRRLKAKISRYELKIGKYEKKYGMTTNDFLRKFRTTGLGDEEAWFHWASDADVLQRLKEKLQNLEGIKID